jgi:hypothetical protein
MKKSSVALAALLASASSLAFVPAAIAHDHDADEVAAEEVVAEEGAEEATEEAAE